MSKKINLVQTQPVNYTSGAIFSETTFYKIKATQGNNVILETQDKIEVTLNKKYVENILFSADSYKSIEAKTNTELNEIIKNNPFKAMSICFTKAAKEKSKKAYNLEVAERIEDLKNAKVSELEELAIQLIENPPLKEIPGELRVIKGYHNNNFTNQGRLNFFDMEDNYVLKQVDPRTVEYVIVNNIKYILK